MNGAGDASPVAAPAVAERRRRRAPRAARRPEPAATPARAASKETHGQEGALSRRPSRSDHAASRAGRRAVHRHREAQRRGGRLPARLPDRRRGGAAVRPAVRPGDPRRHQPARARRAGPRARRGRGRDGQVVDTFEGARARVEEQIETARSAIVAKKDQVARAMEAGREAAQQARTTWSAGSPRPRPRTTRARTSHASRPDRRRPVGVEWRRGRRRLSRWREAAGTAVRTAYRAPARSPARPARLDAARLREARLGQRRRGQRPVPRRRDRVQHPARRRPVRPALVWGFALDPAQPAGRARTSSSSSYIDRAAARARRSPDAPTHQLHQRHPDRRTARLGIWSAVGFVWFSTRLFGSLRTVLAERVRHRAGARDHRGQDLRHQDHDPLDDPDHGERR